MRQVGQLPRIVHSVSRKTKVWHFAGGCAGGSSDKAGRHVFDMIYLLTAIGLSPGDSSTVHIYTQTIHRTIQNKQYIEQHNNFGRVRAVPRLG